MGSRFGPQSASIRIALGFLLISGIVSTGCVNDTGEPLPGGLMSFPIAIELSSDVDAEGEPPRYLYVTSSNFALQYNSGNVQSYDLDKLVEGIFTGCIGAGVADACLDPDYEGNVNDPQCVCDLATDADCVSVPPDRCSVIPAGLRFRDQGAALRLVPVEGLIPGEVQIGSFSDGLALAPNGRRLYVPVRSDADLTFIEVNEEGQLSCGGAFGERHTCTAPYRSGSAEQVNPEDPLVLPNDPVDLHVGSLAADFAPPGAEDDPAFSGEYVLMAHREGHVSLFFDQEILGGPAPEKRPRLVATLSDLAPEQVTISYQPDAKRAWIPSALTTEIVRVGIAIDGDPTQAFLFDSGTLFVTGLDTGASNRDIRFDPRPGRELAYIVSRAPEALVVARTEAPGLELSMVGQVPTCRDPSRIQVAEVPARGESVLLAFVSCFLARRVQIIDTDQLQGVTVLTNISGAFEFAIDGPRRLLYTADFSTSVLRVADLQPLIDCLEGGSSAPEECSPRLLGLVGLPQPVSELPR
ncbi:MAG: hypothetical protein AMJ62_13240 [Myxococcales bacterium SG8_38]|nr:MAG: hypothetical protein AMJ62_13240 [Myxococcales bacterium SG8_38]